MVTVMIDGDDSGSDRGEMGGCDSGGSVTGVLTDVVVGGAQYCSKSGDDRHDSARRSHVVTVRK
jgi:hypothetical protein